MLSAGRTLNYSMASDRVSQIDHFPPDAVIDITTACCQHKLFSIIICTADSLSYVWSSISVTWHANPPAMVYFESAILSVLI